ncbi:hypothetical protein ES705_25384 [subsurface metagenome]
MTPVVAIGTRNKEIEIPSKNANKIARIIKEGLKLKNLSDDLKQEIEKNKLLLIPHAENAMGLTSQKKVIFKCQEGTAEITFSDAVKYLEKDMVKFRKILGPLFDQAFTTDTSYAVSVANIPELKAALGKKYDTLIKEQTTHTHRKKLRDMLSDGDSETSKKLRGLVLIEDKKPTISYKNVTD